MFKKKELKSSQSMKKHIYYLAIGFLLSCNESMKIDTAPLSGTINQSDEKTKIVEKLGKAYTTGTFELANEYFTPDGVHRVNDVVYSTKEIIDGYNFHSLLFDDLKHNDPYITTMFYNNGDVFTNQWVHWSGVSKITGQSHELDFYCSWKWENDEIAETHCYFDTRMIEKEAELFQQKISANGENTNQ